MPGSQFKLALITPPSDEPVTLAQAKQHMNVEHNLDDALINWQIRAAREHVENVIIHRALVTQTWDLFRDAFPPAELPDDSVLELPLPPLQSVTSIKYIDSAGTPDVVLASSEYVVDRYAVPGRIVPGINKSWPSTYAVPNAVTVRFVAGYGQPDLVPWFIRHAILLLGGHWYENREAFLEKGLAEVPEGVQRILAPYRVYTF